MLLMPLLYMPPVSYMALLCASRKVYIEAHENYVKSTCRNKCTINGANGLINLSIPLKGGRDHRRLYSEALIDYNSNWQHRHYMAIISCYGSAPFFEHYMPYLKPFYEKQYAHLFEYNKLLLGLLIKLMKLDTEICYTGEYVPTVTNQTDLRKAFKNEHLPENIITNESKFAFNKVKYMQVFEGGEQLLNTSCIDLLFNEGPIAKTVLQQMAVKH